MLRLQNVSIASLPTNLHIHGVLAAKEVIALSKLILNKRFEDADSFIKRKTNAKMTYSATYWTEVTGETTVTLEIAGIVNASKEGTSFCKSIW